MLANTPPMGWNSWNGFGPRVSEDLVRQTADSLVSLGLRDLGYRYVVIDDCWALRERGRNRELVPDPERFSLGMRPLADYVHGLGLKLGIYSDAAELTCAGYPGSFGFEDQDAALWASWGIDFLKYDYCHAPQDQATAIERYTRMGEALKKTGREILYSICEWGGRNPHLWARRAGGHMWRATPDVLDSWTDVWVEKSNWTGIGIDSAIEAAAALSEYGGPGGWNDLDMLVVGLHGSGSIPGEGATLREYRTQMSLWCMLCSPLMIGCDLRSREGPVREILSNPELIAVNQDPLGRPAVRVRRIGQQEIWRKPMEDGSIVVALLNRGATVADMALRAADAGVLDSFRGTVRDLWKREVVAEYSPAFARTVQPHETVVLRLTP
ncbi:MAG: glycoside hydrolase family 27 protein [Spirochaetia bacterium]